MIGTTLGHYRVIERLGAGGMGEVFAAEDTKLGRQVALKLLPPTMAAQPEWRSRFEREARAVAALSHPGIVTIFSVEEVDGVNFITMELVRGEPLDKLIDRGGMPLGAFLRIAIPLADALSAAHAAGVVHRDLKPSNLLIGDDGRPHILDFGLAKLQQEAMDPAASQLPTEAVTGEGRVLGTAAYMSPEQAQGLPIDHRSDLFSLGIVLYEMLAGRRPFLGRTPTEVLASILKDTPESLNSLDPEIPQALARVIKLCLVKDPDHRYQSAKDLRNELEMLEAEVASGELTAIASASSPARRARWPLLLAGTTGGLALFALAAAYLSGWEPRDLDIPPRVIGTTQLTRGAANDYEPALSPDGAFFVYSSYGPGRKPDIFWRRVGGDTVINLTENCEDDDSSPAVSPDGSLVAYATACDGGGIMVMGVTGESARRLTQFGYDPAWSPDGSRIAFSTVDVEGSEDVASGGRLWVVDAAGGEPRPLGDFQGMQPSWSPGGHRIAFWGHLPGSGPRQFNVWTIPADGGKPVAATTGSSIDWNPVWSPDGNHLYFVSNRGGDSKNIWRMPIDERTGQPLAEPQTVTAGGYSERIDITISADGRRLAYRERLVSLDSWRVAVDRDSLRLRAGPVPFPLPSVSSPRPSPDSRWVAYERPAGTLYVARADGTEPRQLTFPPERARHPRWAPDGRLGFYSDRSGTAQIWTMSPDGSERAQLTHEPGRGTIYHAWSPDGRRLAVGRPGVGTGLLEFADALQGREAQPLPPLPFDGEHFLVQDWSPDGRLLLGSGRTADRPHGSMIIYDLDSQEYRRIAGAPSGPGIRWLANSRHAAVVIGGALVLVDSVTGEQRELIPAGTPDAGELSSTTLPAGSEWIYFARNRIDSDIWMLTLEQIP